MRYLFIILTLFSTNLFAQNYIAQWTSSLHDYYEVQQSSDNVNWNTIGKVSGVSIESTYQYVVPSAGYFYRIKADNVNSNSIFLEAKILPVTLVDFFIKGNTLSWTVENEQNIDYYLIESSKDGVTFVKVREVKADGRGTYKIITR